MLLHQPFGQVGYGQVTDLELAAKEILRMRDLLEEILANHTGQSRERIHADTDRDYVMEASEALEYGIIDQVISSRSVIDRAVQYAEGDLSAQKALEEVKRWQNSATAGNC